MCLRNDHFPVYYYILIISLNLVIYNIRPLALDLFKIA